MLEDFVERFLRGAPADIGLGARAEAFGELGAELDLVQRLRLMQRLRIGVGDDEAAPSSFAVIMLLAALRRRPYPRHGDPRFQLDTSGAWLMVMSATSVMV
jgi:hypothetical protein